MEPNRETTPGEKEAAPKAVESTLSVAVLQDLILKKNGLRVSEDDPLLAAFTLHEAFIQDYDAMLERHNVAVTTILGKTVTTLRTVITEEGKVVADTAHALSTGNVLALVGEHRKAMAEHLHAVRQMTWLNLGVAVFTAALIVGGLVWKA